MELVLNGNTLPTPVTPAQIAEAIHSLTGDGDSFAILASGEQHYIQTSGGPAHGFIMEYRDGSEELHFSCANSSLSADEVIAAFRSYLAQDDRWRANYEWLPLANNYSVAPGRKTTLLTGIASLALGLPLVTLAGLGGLKLINDPAPMSIRVTFLVAGLFGLFLTSVGVRLALNRPRADGGLISPLWLGAVGVAFVAFAVFWAFGAPCTSCTVNSFDTIVPSALSLFLAVLCFRALLRRRKDTKGNDT